jgi:hypothetical protein
MGSLIVSGGSGKFKIYRSSQSTVRYHYDDEQSAEPQCTLNEIVDLGYNAPGVKLNTLLNTLGGICSDFCYIYV